MQSIKKMLVTAAGVAAVGSMGLAPAAHAQLLTENFDYEAGPLETVSGGAWATANTGDSIQVVDGNLSTAGGPTPSGRQANFAGGGLDYSRPFTQTSAGTIYYSLALKVNEIDTVTDTDGGYFAGFIAGTSATGTNFGATLWARDAGEGLYNLGINARTSEAGTAFTTETFAEGDTVFVVGSYTFNEGTANDVATLYVQPAPATFGGTAPAPAATSTNTGTDLADAGRFFLRQDSVAETGDYTVDSIRVGTSYGDVTAVPEPGVAGLVGLSVGAIALRRRRRSA